MSEQPGAYMTYVDVLAENSELLRLLRKSRDKVEELLADPFLECKSRIWGVLSIKRLSEWDQLWEEKMVPILKAAGIEAERPWAAKVRRYVKQQEWRHKRPPQSDPDTERFGLDQ